MEQMPNSVGLALDQGTGVGLSVFVMNTGPRLSSQSLSVAPSTDGIFKVQESNPIRATYNYTSTALALTASPANLFAIESGPLKTTRIRSVIIWNPGLQSSAGFVTFNLTQTTTAGSTNASVPTQMDLSDPAYTGTVRTASATIGTLGTVLYQFTLWVPGAAASAAPYLVPLADPANIFKPLVIPPGINNGVVCQVATGNAGATSLFATVVFTEE